MNRGEHGPIFRWHHGTYFKRGGKRGRRGRGAESLLFFKIMIKRLKVTKGYEEERKVHSALYAAPGVRVLGVIEAYIWVSGCMCVCVSVCACVPVYRSDMYVCSRI